MPQLLIRILVAAATFLFGLAASALWGMLTPSSPARTTEHTEVRVVIVRPGEATAHGNYGWGEPGNKPPAPDARLVSGGILNGKAVSKPAPAYPTIAKQARAQGTVVVSVVVGEHGEVVSAEPVKGHPLLRQAAAEAVRRWKFPPTMLSGRPVKVAGSVTVNFALE
ncbi:MAG TPA: energy transducer TonB [Pyrinomonadaceae bacterium]|nr:energy transducer TonB [Pyrinomonadaceae bacterium]